MDTVAGPRGRTSRPVPPPIPRKTFHRQSSSLARSETGKTGKRSSVPFSTPSASRKSSQASQLHGLAEDQYMLYHRLFASVDVEKKGQIAKEDILQYFANEPNEAIPFRAAFFKGGHKAPMALADLIREAHPDLKAYHIKADLKALEELGKFEAPPQKPTEPEVRRLMPAPGPVKRPSPRPSECFVDLDQYLEFLEAAMRQGSRALTSAARLRLEAVMQRAGCGPGVPLPPDAPLPSKSDALQYPEVERVARLLAVSKEQVSEKYVQVLLFLAIRRFVLGHLDVAVKVASEGLAVADKLRDATLSARCHALQAMAQAADMPARADQSWQNAAAALEKKSMLSSSEEVLLFFIYTSRAELQASCLNFEAAEAHYTTAIRFVETPSLYHHKSQWGKVALFRAKVGLLDALLRRPAVPFRDAFELGQWLVNHLPNDVARTIEHAKALLLLGHIYSKKNMLSTAAANYERALAIALDGAPRSVQEDCMVAVAGSHQRRGNPHLANKYYQLALEIATEMGNEKRQLELELEIADIYIIMKKYSLALQRLNRAEDLSSQSQNNAAKAAINRRFAEVLVHQKNIEAAIPRYEAQQNYLCLCGDHVGAHQVGEIVERLTRSIQSNQKDRRCRTRMRRL